MVKSFIEIVLTIFILSLCVWGIFYWDECIPRMYRSVIDKQCVKIITIENGVEVINNCSDMPETYITVWVR